MEKQKRIRERLSARDHQRAVDIANSTDILVGILEQMYPTDVELRIMRGAIQRFRSVVGKAEAEAKRA